MDDARALLDTLALLDEGYDAPTPHPFLALLDAAEAGMDTGLWPDIGAALRAPDGDHTSLPYRASLFALRDAYIARFGFAVPTPAFASIVAPYGPFLEVGAGKGTLGRLLRAAGVPCVSTDAEPWAGAWRVQQMDAATALARYPHRTVLCSWPSLDESWLADILPRFRPGQRLLLIGEGRGGCTGNGKLFNTLDGWIKGPTPRGALWSWPGIHDTLQVWTAP